MKKNPTKTPKKVEYTCIKLLSTLNEKEINQLQKFVISPYFNNDQTVVKLLAHLTKVILNDEILSENIKLLVYKKIFSDKVKAQQLSKQQQDRLVRKLNILGKLIEQFLVIEALKEKPAHFSDFLSEELIAKKQYDILKRHLKQNHKKLQNTKIKDVEFYYHQFKLTSYKLENYYLQGAFDKKIDIDFERFSLNLDMYYMLMKLDFEHSMFSISENVIKKIDDSSIINITDLSNIEEFNNYAQVTVRKASIKLLIQQTDSSYYELLQLIDQQKSEFGKRDLQKFYFSIINFCIAKIKEGKFDLTELLSIYKKMSELNLHIEKNSISIVHLKNIITVACKIKDFEWAIKTLNKYKKYVYEENRNNVYNLNYCAILYYQKFYKEALQYAIKVEPFDVLYNKTCRIMMMKCHYELDQEYDERSERIFRSADKYFKNMKQLNSSDRLGYRNFFQIFINLYRLKHGVGKMSLARLKEKLENQSINSDKAWLLSKIRLL